MFKRGFKAWCEICAREQRKLLGLKPTDPIDLKKLADFLDIEVWKADEVPAVSSATLDVLTVNSKDHWSAITLFHGGRAVIILNPTHSPARCASNLAHELAHILLAHTPARVDVSKEGVLLLHSFEKEQEAEASWLAGCLLLPKEALTWLKHQGISSKEAQKLYGVSADMFRYRAQVTGPSSHKKKIAKA